MIKGKLKNMLSIRSDMLYCPLCFSLDTYSNCDTQCNNCYLRRLNNVWDKDNRPADITLMRSKLERGLDNPNPRTPLAWAIKNKKVIRFGNKSDPFQEAEKKYRVSRDALVVLEHMRWPTVIQTKFLHNLEDYIGILIAMKDYLWVMPVMSPGMDSDWVLFEKGIPTPPIERLETSKRFMKEGIQVGFNGEPFIPGYHAIYQFKETIKLLKSFKIKSYNTYNFHWNEFVAKRLHAIGIDIEKIWFYNQDKEWAKILPKLIEIAKKYDIVLGCPDFINSGRYPQPNTCCGLNVSNPCTFNLHTWKQVILGLEEDKEDMKIINVKQILLEKSWDGVGDQEEGRKAMFEKSEDRFGMEDIRWNS